MQIQAKATKGTTTHWYSEVTIDNITKCVYIQDYDFFFYSDSMKELKLELTIDGMVDAYGRAFQGESLDYKVLKKELKEQLQLSLHQH